MSGDPPIRPRRTRVQKLLLAIGVVLSMALLGAAGIAAYLRGQLDRFERLPLELAAIEDEELEPKNFLVVGSDSREVIAADDEDAGAFLTGDNSIGQRADSIFVVRTFPEGDRLEILAFPRDLWVEIPPVIDGDEMGEGRINGTYNDGPQQVVNAITHNFDIEINHYVEIDFRGFRELVDVVDGVPMYFETAVRDRASGLFVEQAGCATLDGSDSLAFVRARNFEVSENGRWRTDPSGDLGRITRQQEFLRAAMGRVTGLDLGDIFTLRELVDAGVDHVRLDEELGIGELVSLGERIGTFEDHALRTHQIPTEPFRTSGGAEVLRPVELAGDEIFALFRGEVDELVTTTSVPADRPTPSQLAVSVLNGSGIPGQANTLADDLAGAGFAIDRTENADTSVGTTQVWYGSANLTGGEVVQSWLSGPAQLVETADLGPDEIVVVTGPDLGAVRTEPALLEIGDDSALEPSGTTTTSEPPGLAPVAAEPGSCG